MEWCVEMEGVEFVEGPLNSYDVDEKRNGKRSHWEVRSHVLVFDSLIY